MLPGPTWLRLLEAIALVLAVVAILVFLVFPFIADTFFTEGSRLGEP